MEATAEAEVMEALEMVAVGKEKEVEEKEAEVVAAAKEAEAAEEEAEEEAVMAEGVVMVSSRSPIAT